MRWNTLQLNTGEPETEPGLFDRSPGPVAAPPLAAPALFERGAISRTFDTPGFRGITFFEIQSRSIINKVPEA